MERLELSDLGWLTRLVGPTTLARGEAYFRTGRVLAWRWEGPARLVGTVQGNAAHPYQVSVTNRSRGAIQLTTSDCTCPVGIHCKHAVALVVAAAAAYQRQAPSAPQPEWAGRVEDLLGSADLPGGGATPGAGLQFEAVVGGPGRLAGVMLRPVMRSHSGRWVRTGIAWRNLDYFRLSAPDGVTAPVIALLKELRALNQVSPGTPHWAAPSETVRLESIASRRVWDLLGELAQRGAPLLLSGPGSVQLSDPVEVMADVTRRRGALSVQGRYLCTGEDIVPRSALAIGEPPHGLAWGREADGGGVTLALAPFVSPPTPAQRRLFASGPLRVPAADAERFLAEVCPRLADRLDLVSSDASVDLAALPRPSLLLGLRHHPDHRVELSWHRGLAGGWREPLWSGDGTDWTPALHEAVEAATHVAAKLAPLVRVNPAEGVRLTPLAVLHGMDTVVFLTDLLPALAELSGVVIETEGVALDYRPAPAPPALRFGGQSSKDGDWFDLQVEVSVGGEEVVLSDLLMALASGQSHLILPSGTYCPLDTPDLAELARLVAEARQLSDAAPLRITRFQASLWEDLSGLGALDGAAAAWEESVRRLTTAAADHHVPLPAGLQATLRPYQQEGFAWLAFLYQHGLGGILADDMGLGKTLQALALVLHARRAEPEAAPFLVVCPTSVVGNWVSEARRFAPDLSVVAVENTSARRRVPLSEVVAGADLVITSYALLRLDHEHYSEQSWSGLFLDEAQFVKNPASHVHRRAKALPVPFKLAMTGTPLENNLMELWSILSVCAPGLFPRPDRFTEHYRLPIERQGDTERLDQLRRRIRPLVLRRTKEQVAPELPDKQEQVLELDLEARHRRVYDTYLQRERQKILGLLGDMEKNRFAIFRSLTLLRQASLDVSLVDPDHASVPSTKLDFLGPMLEEVVADGHRVLVFSQFTRFLSLARRRLVEAGIDHSYLDGRTRRRAEVIEDFRQGRKPVFLVSLKAGGFGLNLTEADYCILLDPWWNPAAEAQAVDRVHRIGQARKVMVYRLVAKDTIEEKVMALKARKADLFASVLDSGAFESTALGAEDIRHLLGA